jgi:hypothetical protein
MKIFKDWYLFVVAFLSLIFLFSCSPDKSTEPENNEPAVTNDYLVDNKATFETVALYNNLKTLAASKLLFGHQETTAYGVGWWGEFGRSDIKDVCGDFPAVYGWDVGDIHKSANVDGVYFSTMVNLIKQSYARGGINTISMYLDNPATGGDAWDNSAAVASILPGGENHDSYIQTLSKIADFLLELQSGEGDYIPIIFRPYHEHNHSWSWWGSNSCSVDEYNSLWKMTVEYFRDEREVHHLLYTISPQDIWSQFDYLDRYPGDDYVDILGLDSYSNNLTQLKDALSIVGQLAESRSKISALTEVGLENLIDFDWFTKYLLAGVESSVNARKTA